MAVFAAIVLAALFLEHDDLVALDELLLDFADNLGAGYGGRAYGYCTIGVNQQYAVKLNGASFLGFVAEVVNIKELVLFGLKLLALDFYNYVHLRLIVRWLGSTGGFA